MTSNVSSSGLSSRLMSMKFMQRSQGSGAAQGHAAPKREALTADHWVAENYSALVDGDASASVVVNTQWKEPLFENLVPGRRSFGSFNAKIERSWEMAAAGERLRADAESDSGSQSDDESEDSDAGVPRRWRNFEKKRQDNQNKKKDSSRPPSKRGKHGR